MNRKNFNIFVLLVILTAIIVACVPPEYRKSSSDENLFSTSKTSSRLRSSIVTLAKRQIGIKYKSGSSTPQTGFDCSGLALYVYQKHGIFLPRTSQLQYGRAKKISSRNTHPGDLIFFKINGRNISHVAIYIGNNNFVHAPGKGKTVCTDSMTNAYWKNCFAGCGTFIK